MLRDGSLPKRFGAGPRSLVSAFLLCALREILRPKQGLRMTDLTGWQTLDELGNLTELDIVQAETLIEN